MPEAPLILIADDEADILVVTATRLEAAGYRTVTAADGREALDILRHQQPDLVLLDLRMPKVDGYEFCRTVKDDPNLDRVPVILFSASSSRAENLRDKCLALGADGYISKPFISTELLAAVEHALARPGGEPR
ncbi:MAG TPA: response regulator [candidate division WOR-3 bacterium]|uniref:Response regulator n=1 Tax=candidate division WOR-3 bacterium TaxID=2052148 RepID=A0A7V0T6G5_UNCW3|nr:response regulator [candidate division WOR-3 bacterium]